MSLREELQRLSDAGLFGKRLARAVGFGAPVFATTRHERSQGDTDRAAEKAQRLGLSLKGALRSAEQVVTRQAGVELKPGESFKSRTASYCVGSAGNLVRDGRVRQTKKERLRERHLGHPRTTRRERAAQQAIAARREVAE